MKNILRAIAAAFLAFAARLVLRRYRPKIVMVTGSVGKTSTKDAIALVLAERFLVRKSEKSFNSEFGVPFTILNAHNPWGNALSWLVLVKNTLALLLLPNHYPNMLVLEVGADKPGDLERILRIAKPDAVVVTHLPDVPVHVEAYASPEAVRDEEFSPAYALLPGAPLIINADSPYALEMSERLAARKFTYGLGAQAQYALSRSDFFTQDGEVIGLSVRIRTPEGEGNALLRGAAGAPQALALVAAVATGAAFDIGLSESLARLVEYEAPPGRLSILRGKNGSVLIGDTYNSSPTALAEALEVLAAFPGAKRRIAILGDMLELGRHSVAEHERLGALAREKADIVIPIGIRARAFVPHSAGEGEDGELRFNDARAAAEALADFPQPGDVILLKGSQSIRVERVTAALLADPADAARLPRQDAEWKKR
jgi:UDP-N-acetylmuramyl pentapeptide synthase